MSSSACWPLAACTARVDRRSTPTECTRSSHRTCRGGCPHPPVGLWPLLRHGSIGDRPLQSAPEARTAPVGADVLIRLSPFGRFAARVDRRSTPTRCTRRPHNTKSGLSQNSNRIERCTKTWQGMCAGGGLEPPARSITRPQAAQNAQLSNWSCAFCTGAGS